MYTEKQLNENKSSGLHHTFLSPPYSSLTLIYHNCYMYTLPIILEKEMLVEFFTKQTHSFNYSLAEGFTQH